MKVMRIFMIIAICYCDSGQCLIPLIPLAIGGGIASGLAGMGYMTMCRFKECCTDNYIPADFVLLNKLLKDNLYGQQLAHDTVLYALRSHVNTKEPQKALAMSFHGLPGTGKNYVADFIVKALYKKGEKSKYVHNYQARLKFRSDELTEQYQGELQREITKHLKACPRSIFIFDEVEKIPTGLLDILVPFLDYNPKIQGVDYPTQAIFIFLSNTGGTQLADYMVNIWKEGKTRKDASPQELERILALAAFNEKGGFHRSDTIESSLIDHYIPFLPLERGHVRRCAIDSFQRKDIEPSNELIDEALSYLSFGPAPHNLYSSAGCKALNQKVGAIIEKHLYSEEYGNP